MIYERGYAAGLTAITIIACLAGVVAVFRPAFGGNEQMRTTEVQIEVNDATIARGDLFEVIEPAWNKVSIYDGVAEYEAALSGYSLQQRLVLAILWYRTEVNNGGHDQFFYNSTGIVWPDVVDGFEAIGLLQAATIIRETVSRLGTESRSREMRQSALEEHQPDFEDLDNAFFELESTGEIDERALAYVRENAGAFYFKGTVTRAVMSNGAESD